MKHLVGHTFWCVSGCEDLPDVWYTDPFACAEDAGVSPESVVKLTVIVEYYKET